MISVAAVNEALNLSGLRPHQALKATHKGLMRDAMSSGNAPIPRYVRTFNEAETRSAIEKIGFPVILKTTQSSGSRGIYRFESFEELNSALNHVRAVAGIGGEILVEEFIDGPEVSVETISFDGDHHIIAITDKITTGNPHWVEKEHSEPSMLPQETQEAIIETTHKGLTALEIMQSTSHVEIKIGKSGPKIMEIGARLGGDYITAELVPRSTGINMVKAAIALALGIPPEITPTRKRGAAIRYIIGTPGKIKRIAGVDDAQSNPDVKIVELFVKIGDKITAVSSSLDRHGYIIAEGINTQTAIQNAEAAQDKIKITTE